MDWYYVKEGQPIGPVSEKNFHHMVRTGVVLCDTLIWREGMTEWQPCSRVQLEGMSAPVTGTAGWSPGEAEAVCAHCRQFFPAKQGKRFGANWVCAGCQPEYLKNNPGAAPLRWHEYAWIGLPLALIFSSGLIGGACGGAAASINRQIFPKIRNPALKYLYTGLVTGGAFIANAVLALLIHSLLRKK